MVTTGFFGGGRGSKPGVASLANLKDRGPRVRLGQQCSVSPDSYPDRKYKAVVREIAPEANRQKVTIQVKGAIREVDSYLRPETNAKVNFLEEATQETAAESRILVPKGAVVTSQGTSSVFLMKDQRCATASDAFLSGQDVADAIGPVPVSRLHCRRSLRQLRERQVEVRSGEGAHEQDRPPR